MTSTNSGLQAVIFDWAGTTIDFGSRAPTNVFVKVFEESGVPITIEEARAPMGQAKRDHLRSVLNAPRVARAWTEKHGRGATEQDVDRLYEQFLPLQKQTLADHCDVIPGVPAAVEHCRHQGLRIGSSTGYTRELMEVVIPRAQAGGYQADAVVCAGDVAAGRPAPWMIYRNAEMLGVYPMHTIIKVDDTPVGIEAGRNAGTWTVAISKTGNAMGLSEADLGQLEADELRSRLETIRSDFLARGAHYVVESAADLPRLLPIIQQRLHNGERP